jgi:hypothetical protein
MCVASGCRGPCIFLSGPAATQLGSWDAREKEVKGGPGVIVTGQAPTSKTIFRVDRFFPTSLF